MSKKLLVLIMSAIMVTGALAGCGGSNDSSKSSSASSSSASTTSSSSSSSSSSSASTNSSSASASSSASKTQSASAADNNADAQVIEVPVTIINNTDVDFYELYTSGAGVDDWGESLIPQGQVLAPGTQLSQIAFTIDANNLKWDLMAKDEAGDSLEFYGLDLSNCSTDGITISLTYDRNTQTGTITAQ